MTITLSLIAIAQSFDGLRLDLETGEITSWATNQGPTYRPSGTMCKGCAHIKADCSALPFNTMPQIKRDSDGAVVVKCLNFEREAK